jgi:hypothetical protein
MKDEPELEVEENEEMFELYGYEEDKRTQDAKDLPEDQFDNLDQLDDKSGKKTCNDNDLKQRI